MQALYTHLERPVLPEPQRGFSVQGLNTPFQGESSFQALLKKEVFMQEFKAREGPPERSFDSVNGMRSTAESAPHKTENTAYSQKTHEERPVQKSSAESEEEKAVRNEGNRESIAGGKKADEHARAQKEGKNGTVEADNTKAGDDSADEMSFLQKTEDTHGTGMLSLVGSEVNDVFEADSKKGIGRADAKKARGFSDSEKDAFVENTGAESTQEFLSAQTAALVSFEQTDEVQTHKAHRTETAEFKADDAELENVFASDKLNRAAEEPGVNLAEIPAIKVRDERTKTAAAADKKQPLLSSVRYDGKGNAEADILLNPADGSKGAADPSVLAKGGNSSFTAEARESKQSNFASMLSSEIRNNAADLVKTGSIILRDGNKGTINLILHPEELGNVKIRLQISDNILTGRITVASEEAYKAFKANIASLTEVFTSSGFDTAGFDLNWSGGRESGTGGQQADGGHTAHNPLAFRYDEQNPVLDGDEAEYRVLESRPYVNLIA